MAKFALLLIFLVSGCASGKSVTDGLIRLQGAETIKGADTIKVADKVSDKIDAKLEINPELQTQIGLNNSVDRSSKDNIIKAGRDVSTTSSNDSEVMKTYLKQTTTMYERLLNIFKVIILALIGFITKQELQIKKQYNMIISRLLDARDRDDKNEQEMLEKALNKKEA